MEWKGVFDEATLKGGQDCLYKRAVHDVLFHGDNISGIVSGIGNVGAVVTGKAGALRVPVPKLNMQIPFDENDEYDIEVCFRTISELIEAVNVFGVACGLSDLK